MGLIRRKWTPAAADEWTREDWIAIVLSVISYVGLAIGVPLAFFTIWGWIIVGVALAAMLLMIFIIDPKLKAVSESYEKQQKKYLEELDRQIRWEDQD